MGDKFNNLGIEVAPIITQDDNGASFKGFGNSHFTFKKNEGFHVTTEVPGLNQGMHITDRFDVGPQRDDYNRPMCCPHGRPPGSCPMGC